MGVAILRVPLIMSAIAGLLMTLEDYQGHAAPSPAYKLSELSVEELDDDGQERLHRRFCTMPDSRRRIAWMLQMGLGSLIEYQRWPQHKQELWWQYVSYQIGCRF